MWSQTAAFNKQKLILWHWLIKKKKYWAVEGTSANQWQDILPITKRKLPQLMQTETMKEDKEEGGPLLSQFTRVHWKQRSGCCQPRPGARRVWKFPPLDQIQQTPTPAIKVVEPGKDLVEVGKEEEQKEITFLAICSFQIRACTHTHASTHSTGCRLCRLKNRW